MANNRKVDSYGITRYYKDDQLHREDGPAVIKADGTEEWWYEGSLHREDGPAVSAVCSDGSVARQWMLHGKRHRIGGPAVVGSRDKYEYKIWYQNGLLHREDGPAYEAFNCQEWWLRGKSVDPFIVFCMGEGNESTT